MKKKLRVLNTKGIATIFLVVTYIILFLSAVSVIAADYDFKFSDDSSLKTSLLQFKDKSVEISLRSGEQISGKISNIGSHVILLRELKGKEYYDALINIDEIAAVVFRAR